MQLPFTVEQFLGVFVSYNDTVWPAQIVLNLLGILAIVSCFRASVPSRLIAAVLAVLWAWTGAVYHLLFFSQINPAAIVFGSLFIVQAGVFAYHGVIRGDLRFGFDNSRQAYAGALLMAYGMVIYPVLGYFLGHRYPASPTFGAPCPTAIFTFGLLLWATGRVKWYMLMVPLAWSLVGFGAAVTLGIREDVGLLIAGGVAAGILLTKRGSNKAGAAV